MKIKKLFLPLLLIFSMTLGYIHAYALAEIGSDEFDIERALIARTVEQTAPDASYVARLAIAAVIVNRTKDPRFPSDVRSVIYDYDMFRCTYDPSFELCSYSYLSDIAARDALLGFDCSAGALYFRAGYPSERDGACFYHSGWLFYNEYQN